MVFPELPKPPKSTKLGKKILEMGHSGFVLWSTSSCHLAGEAKSNSPSCHSLMLKLGGRQGCADQNLGKHRLEYIWPLICKTRRKKEQKKELVFGFSMGHSFKSVLGSPKLLPSLKETTGFLFCVWAAVLLG